MDSETAKCPTCGGGVSMRDNFAPGRWRYGCVNRHEWGDAPAAAPHAAPREDEPEVSPSTAKDWFEVARRLAVRNGELEAALDAAGEEMDRLIEWRDEYSLFHGPKCSQARSYRGIGERVCTCGSVRLRKMLDAIAAARASHPEARDGE